MMIDDHLINKSELMPDKRKAQVHKHKQKSYKLFKEAYAFYFLPAPSQSRMTCLISFFSKIQFQHVALTRLSHAQFPCLQSFLYEVKFPPPGSIHWSL